MKVKFKISYKKDVETFFAFLGEKHNTKRVMNWAIYSIFPYLKKIQLTKRDKKFVDQFVLFQYKTKAREMKENMAIYENQWRKVEPLFSRLTQVIFGSRKWPKGKYIAFATIWGMYPRFLEDKTFQIPFKYPKPAYINVVIAHELLHFMFYDYCFAKYPQYKKESYELLMWHASEIFNPLIQNSAKWQKIFGLPTMPYPEHEKAIKQLHESIGIINSKNLDRAIDVILLASKEIL